MKLLPPACGIGGQRQLPVSGLPLHAEGAYGPLDILEFEIAKIIKFSLEATRYCFVDGAGDHAAARHGLRFLGGRRR